MNQQTTRRGEVLHAVIATADSRRDGALPLDVDGVADTFGDELALLGALQLRWHTRLAGRQDPAVERVGAEIERRARAPTPAAPRQSARRGHVGTRVLDRIRAALAA